LIVFYGKVNFVALVVIYFLLTLAASHVFCVLVEEPSMRFGKKLTSGGTARRAPVQRSHDTWIPQEGRHEVSTQWLRKP
jgi:peptidoglycan/LPS O-acetylase OafA/YrhL